MSADSERHDLPDHHAGLALRENAPRVLGTMVRRCVDFWNAEDVQHVVIAALEQWPARGLPHNPSGWLLQVAPRALVDRHRLKKEPLGEN